MTNLLKQHMAVEIQELTQSIRMITELVNGLIYKFGFEENEELFSLYLKLVNMQTDALLRLTNLIESMPDNKTC